MPYFPCRTEFCSIARDVLIGAFILGVVGAVISLGASGLELFSAR